MRAGIATGSNVFMVHDSQSGAALKGAVSVELPSIELSTEEFSGAGVAGKVNVAFPGSMEPMTAVIKCPVIYGDITKYMELGTVRTVDLRNEIIVQNPDSHAKEKGAEPLGVERAVKRVKPGFDRTGCGRRSDNHHPVELCPALPGR